MSAAEALSCMSGTAKVSNEQQEHTSRTLSGSGMPPTENISHIETTIKPIKKSWISLP